MKKIEIINITLSIVEDGKRSIQKKLNIEKLPIDYVAIFSQSQEEYEELTSVITKLGKRVEETSTGFTYKLYKPLKTNAGELHLIKIRKHDPKKKQRGAPDFRVKDYKKFKQRHLNKDYINLIKRPNYEMLELIGNDILVYFPNKPLSEELKSN